MRYCYSGHESFPCRSLWLKKGYDFARANKDFNDSNAVVDLGVGKNMVSSIRYWLKSFGLYDGNGLTPLAHYVFDTESGKDPFIEDLGTLWLLHYLLVSSREATLYYLTFTKFQRERKQFERSHLINYVKRYMTEVGRQKMYNENTTKKDVGVLLLNYVLPKDSTSSEDYSSLLIDLDLIHVTSTRSYYFNTEGKRAVIPEIFLYAIVDRKQGELSVSYDMLQDIGLIFCMSDMEVIDMLKKLSVMCPKVHYSDVAGVRQLQFTEDITTHQVLESYYSHAKV